MFNLILTKRQRRFSTLPKNILIQPLKIRIFRLIGQAPFATPILLIRTRSRR